MIENERQYRITKAQTQKLERAIAQLEIAPIPADVHPLLRQAEIEGVRSQVASLQAQLAQYEALQSGECTVLELTSFGELPQALIQARIVAGLSQEGLAEKLGLKKQQIQQYEASKYASASFQRVHEVLRALGVHVREDVFLPSAQLSLEALFQRLAKVGLDRDFVIKRFLSRVTIARWQAQEIDAEEEGHLALQVATAIGRVFGWTPGALFGTTPLQLDLAPLGGVRLKVPARADERRVSAYTIYVHYLALLLLAVSPATTGRTLPTTWQELRQAVLDQHGNISFEHVLRYSWSQGVPVLPLRDSGAFHGACWRIGGRNVIVLKQQTSSSSRWSFDLLHELWHVSQKPDQQELVVLEAGGAQVAGDSADEEQEASTFAGDVLLAGRAEELAQECVRVARGSLEGLKSAVPKVAASAGVAVDALANYMAFRLSLQGESWWGAANNLQSAGEDPWKIARSVFLENVSLRRLNEAERDLLLQALSDVEV